VAEADRVIDHITDVIRHHWRSELFRQGGTQADCDAIEPAFLHAGFEYPMETT
jgi:hypothetical protein